MTIVFVSLESWDDIWRRNQFFCDGILTRNIHANILFVQPAHDNSFSMRKGNFQAVRSRPTLISGGYGDRLQLLTPTKWFPNSVSLGRKLNQKSFSSEITSSLIQLQWTPTHLWVNQHEAAHLLSGNMASSTLYDITDDWTKFSGNQSQLDLITSQDAALCKCCDHVIVCSQQLFDDKAKLVDVKRLHLIPNGVYVEHYEAVGDTSLPVHKIAEHWTKPVIGYTGTIHGDRVDVSLIASIAQANPAATIAMVGPNLLQQAEQQILDRFSNIVFTGSQPYADLPNIMRSFDVCIVPHLVTPFTESLNPIKLWEYLAAGKPIVSTNVAGFRDYPDLVSIADTPDEFVRLLTLAPSENPGLQARRQQVARQHTWDQRISVVEALLADKKVAHVG